MTADPNITPRSVISSCLYGTRPYDQAKVIIDKLAERGFTIAQAEPTPSEPELPPIVDGSVVLTEHSGNLNDARWLSESDPDYRRTGRSIELFAEPEAVEFHVLGAGGPRALIEVYGPRAEAVREAMAAERSVGIWIEREATS